MKKVFLIQLVILVLGTVIIALALSTQQAISYNIGAALILANLIIVTWVWSQILQKKFVALSVSIIVFKYAIFGFIIYKILGLPNVDSVWFSVGLSTMVPTVLIYAATLAMFT
jgi:hypothetical protein